MLCPPTQENIANRNKHLTNANNTHPSDTLSCELPSPASPADSPGLEPTPSAASQGRQGSLWRRCISQVSSQVAAEKQATGGPAPTKADLLRRMSNAARFGDQKTNVSMGDIVLKAMVSGSTVVFDLRKIVLADTLLTWGRMHNAFVLSLSA